MKRYEGYAGAVELYEDKLVIVRSGFASLAMHGLKGDKTIPFHSLTSVQLRKPGFWINTGYIQFGVLGSIEDSGGMFDAFQDENSVVFKKKHLPAFLELKAVLEQKMAQKNTPAPSSVPANYLDELEKLAALRDKGILTEEEFLSKKRQLLGL